MEDERYLIRRGLLDGDAVFVEIGRVMAQYEEETMIRGVRFEGQTPHNGRGRDMQFLAVRDDEGDSWTIYLGNNPPERVVVGFHLGMISDRMFKHATYGQWEAIEAKDAPAPHHFPQYAYFETESEKQRRLDHEDNPDNIAWPSPRAYRAPGARY